MDLRVFRGLSNNYQVFLDNRLSPASTVGMKTAAKQASIPVVRFIFSGHSSGWGRWPVRVAILCSAAVCLCLIYQGVTLLMASKFICMNYSNVDPQPVAWFGPDWRIPFAAFIEFLRWVFVDGNAKYFFIGSILPILYTMAVHPRRWPRATELLPLMAFVVGIFEFGIVFILLNGVFVSTIG